VKSRLFGIPWTWLRRATQLLLLAVFLWLFRRTETSGAPELNAPVNALFRLDPLVALSAMFAGKELIWLVWPALVTVILTLLLGRFFCGWVCPLGTMLDIVRRVFPKRHTPPNPRWRVVKFFLLVVVLVSAVVNMPLIGWLNPFSILVRGLTLAVDPALTWTVTTPSTWLLRHAPESVTNISEPIYAWLKAHVLAFSQAKFMWAWVSLAILAAVFALELFERRFWCRNLCPSGALLGLIGRFSLLHRVPMRVCDKCKIEVSCEESCRMGAFNPEGRLLMESCNLCMDCIEGCNVSRLRFRFKPKMPAPAPFEPSRRLFLASLATGVAVPVVARATGVAQRLPSDMIRPPGAKPEQEFLDACVRCAECMKVCVTNALQPVMFEAGLSGAFTPRLVPQMGYCEFNCTLCGQACPTGAIRRLPVAEKRKFVMGQAVFDKNICLPYAKGESCITCEEHCPLPEKAIQFTEVKTIKKATGEKVVVKQPFTVMKLCIGCGICVNKCPVEGARGVNVVRTETVPVAVRKEYEKLEASAVASPSGSGSPY